MAGFLQGNKKTASGISSTTLAYTSAVTAGSTLVACVSAANTAGAAGSDSVNGSWTTIKNISTSGAANDGWMGYKPNTGSGTPTVTYSQTNQDSIGLTILEEGGVQTASLDQSSSNETTSATPAATTITTTVACVAVAMCTVSNGSVTISTSSSGWTVEENTSPNSTSSEEVAAADMVQSSSGAASMNFSVGSSQDCLVIMATFK